MDDFSFAVAYNFPFVVEDELQISICCCESQRCEKEENGPATLILHMDRNITDNYFVPSTDVGHIALKVHYKTIYFNWLFNSNESIYFTQNYNLEITLNNYYSLHP